MRRRAKLTAVALAGLFVLLLLLVARGAGGGGGASGGGAPRVTSTSPVNGATGVALLATVSAVFSKDMDASTINTSTFLLSVGGNAVSGRVSYNGSNRTAFFDPGGALAEGTTYTARITTGAKDTSGNALKADYVWSFTTETLPAPTVVSTTPAGGATGVSQTDPITATFSYDMDPATMSGSTFFVNGGGGGVAGSVSYANRTATFTIAGVLAAGTTYTATVTSGATDVSGTPLAADHVWSFTTTSGPNLAIGRGQAPRIAVGADGHAVAVWFGQSTFDFGNTVHASRYLPGQGWSVPEGIGTAYFEGSYSKHSSLEIGIEPGGGAVAVWKGAGAGFHGMIVSSRYVAGVGWTPPQVLDRGYFPALALDSRGSGFAVWLRQPSLTFGPWEIHAAPYLAGIGWGAPQPIGLFADFDSPPHVAVDENGNATSVWVGNTGADLVASYFPAGLTWGPQEEVFAGSRGIDEVKVAVDGSGNAVAVWLDSFGVVRASRRVGGDGWSGGQEIGQSDRFVRVRADSAGNALALLGPYPNLQATRFSPSLGWAPAEEISSDGYRFDLAMNPAGHAIAVWDAGGARRYSPDTGWGATVQLAPYANYPRTAMNASRTAFAVWESDGIMVRQVE